ncbi:MAG: hypothetical protein ACRC1F_01640 [Metamycoplasmataceae bacterium]
MEVAKAIFLLKIAKILIRWEVILIEKLRKRLDFELLDCKFSNRDNLNFLDIEINYSTLSEIEEKSRIISKILDEIDEDYTKEYYLNIYSPGVEKEIKFEDLDNYINEYIKISLIVPHLNSYVFEGELIKIGLESICMRINMKGCFRKIDFKIENIESIKKSVKVTKTKKGTKQNEK